VVITDQPDPTSPGWRCATVTTPGSRTPSAPQGHRRRNLPFDRWRRHAVWLPLVLLALDLVGWAQALLWEGALAVAAPKTLR
jgi:hypothetical protein